jgi:hypothetical protein
MYVYMRIHTCIHDLKTRNQTASLLCSKSPGMQHGYFLVTRSASHVKSHVKILKAIKRQLASQRMQRCCAHHGEETLAPWGGLVAQPAMRCSASAKHVDIVESVCVHLHEW